jgi:hypothetical protein
LKSEGNPILSCTLRYSTGTCTFADTYKNEQIHTLTLLFFELKKKGEEERREGGMHIL